MLHSAYTEQAVYRSLQIVPHANHQGAVFLARTKVRIYFSTLGVIGQDMEVP